MLTKHLELANSHVNVEEYNRVFEPIATVSCHHPFAKSNLPPIKAQDGIKSQGKRNQAPNFQHEKRVSSTYILYWQVILQVPSEYCLSDHYASSSYGPPLKDPEMCSWSRKAARVLIKSGISVFCAVAKGIHSERQSVQRDCLITTAWLGSEMALIRSRSLKYSACEILLDEIAAFLHPGTLLDERVLACLSVYNYTFGKVNIGNGSVTALAFYKGHLYTGFSDGTIKVWDIKEKQSVLLWEVKLHEKSITCFTVYEPTDNLLSGSADKTVRIFLREKQQSVGRLSAGSKVISLFTANDIILCGTEAGLVKVRFFFVTPLQKEIREILKEAGLAMFDHQPSLEEVGLCCRHPSYFTFMAMCGNDFLDCFWFDDFLESSFEKNMLFGRVPFSVPKFCRRLYRFDMQMVLVG
ncbi:Putative E3 ubiquitin-protein ligase LIN-1 [Dendrobium catenatum]|uniref:E3 ubiquitin-protein ligase LIN-1 n=1 Tax=Dendrobium catenatum TaxID=906689 RepID=A0A2I0VRG1_9ASPA|nr:Putative E3 ubiquitin-protein ligase LIN-1 [Dendrobium catenatum]